MKKKVLRPKACRSCRDLRRELAKANNELAEANKQSAAAVFESKGFDRSRDGEMTFYRGMMKDLVDDYLIRRNPFVIEGKQP